ncbi:hypothetical protein KJ951_02325 [Patescibacteria group bacterium]|nr:hypothetical protein [Patescibacteria group bacterium]MBU1703217.1 hypothetical protein [Patescibacteria group bacterium]MBU1953752.1 hypothetical protein [Patescibacteria group bacterium]
MEKTCNQCTAKFKVDENDLAFYDNISPTFGNKKIQIPPPTLCPKCRLQRRHARRNEYNLYPRSCDLCSKSIVTIYHPAAPFTVYCNNCWWSDKWEGADYGIDYDESIPFFDQFQNLQKKVPRMAIWNHACENSDYTNHSSNLKNCYLATCAIYSENIYHSRWVIRCKDLCDCYQMISSELCYETSYTHGYKIINGYFADSRDCTFVYDCKSCSNCFMCWNLRHKEYCIENKQYSKEEYEKIMAGINIGSYSQYQKYKKQYLEIVRTNVIKQGARLTMCENSSGELLYKCKNVQDSYGCVESRDCRHSHESEDLKDCYDTCETASNCELQYETSGCDHSNNVICSSRSSNVSGAFYTEGCSNGGNLFGCIGLNRKNHCILNKQYTKEGYQKLAAKIAQNMQKNNEWGEFFPISTSPFAYNETTAHEDFQITKKQAKQNGWQWLEVDHKQYLLQTCTLPDDIKDTPDSITKEILACPCGKNYKIVLPELEFYRKMNLPIPRKCPQCRRKDRKKLRPSLFTQTTIKCQKCARPTITGLNPDYPGITYCEKCYLKAVY